MTDPADPSDPSDPSDPVEPIATRDASSVILLRDDPAGGRPQTWMMTRVTQMAFAAGASVFPGGRVDASDSALPWAGQPVENFSTAFGCDLELARGLVGAAVRETFEETGVLLTTPTASLARLQPDVEAGRLSFADLLSANGLAIDGDLIRPWARWVTPAAERVRRYDTRFFVAVLPAGAVAADLSSESTVGAWASAADVLAAAERGERFLMTPTIATLTALAKYDSAADVFAAAASRSLEAVRPTIEFDADGQRWSVLPDGSRWRATPRPTAP